MSDLGQLAGNALLIVASIAIVALGSVLVYRMRKDLFEDDQPTRDERLAPYREAFEDGLIAREEYERICQTIGKGGTSLQEELLHGLSKARINAELKAEQKAQEDRAGQPEQQDSSSSF